MAEEIWELRGKVEQWIADEEAPEPERTILAISYRNYRMLKELCHHLGIKDDDYA